MNGRALGFPSSPRARVEGWQGGAGAAGVASFPIPSRSLCAQRPDWAVQISECLDMARAVADSGLPVAAGRLWARRVMRNSS